MKSKGFTLIELLVVIAIIGILSSVVLASLTTARSKGTDAAIQADMANSRAQAELWYSSNGSNYGTGATAGTSYANCAVTTTMFASLTGTGALTNLLNDAATKSGSTIANANRVVCSADAAIISKWAVMASTTGTGNVCVDSSGASKTTSTTIVNNACN